MLIKYVKDKYVLLLGVLLGISLISVFVRILVEYLNGLKTTSYIIEYRSVSFSGFRYGSFGHILEFGLFAAFTTAVLMVLSVKVHEVKRPLALASIGVATLINVITFVVLNALLAQG